METAPNILVIISDTFRRDNLAAYGGDSSKAPFLNALASEALVFEHFYATSFPTVPARADLLTGQAAFTRQGWEPLRSEWPTVAEMASASGYQTMEVTDVPFLSRDGYGYDRGFADYIAIRGQMNHGHPQSAIDVVSTWRGESDRFAARTMTTAADWLERRTARSERQPFLLVADTWDPHEPWDPPAHYIRKYLPSYAGESIPYPPYLRVSDSEIRSDELDLARAAYLGEVTMVDFWIGYLLQRLEVLGLVDNTVVLFASDHGFYFGEHDCFGKMLNASRWRPDHTPGANRVVRSPLYEEVAHVPLLIRVPGCRPARVRGMAGMPDIAATVIDLIGLDRPAEFGGHSLLDQTRSKGNPTREFAVTSWPMHLPGEVTLSVDSLSRRFDVFMPITVSTQEWSLLYADESTAVELYNLKHDPLQTSNVAADHPAVVHHLHSELVQFLADAGCPPRYIAPRRNLRLDV